MTEIQYYKMKVLITVVEFRLERETGKNVSGSFSFHILKNLKVLTVTRIKIKLNNTHIVLLCLYILTALLIIFP